MNMQYVKNNEPSLEQFFMWLLSINGANEILSDVNKIVVACYFFEDEQSNSLLAKFNDCACSNVNNFKILITNLLKLFPLSENIVLKIIDDNISDDNKAKDLVLAHIAVEQVLYKDTSSLVQAITNSNTLSLLESKNTSISTLKKQVESKKEQYNELKQKGTEEIELEAQVKELAKSIESLEKSCSKESLEAEKEKLKKKLKEIDKLKVEHQQTIASIANLEEDVNRYSKISPELNTSLSALVDVAKNLKESEE